MKSLPACALLLFTILLCLAPAAAQQDSEAPYLLVSLDGEGMLQPLGAEEDVFGVELSTGKPGVLLEQPWQFNVYAQFYFPGEDPQIDYAFLGNRRYPRLLQTMPDGASVIWVNTAATLTEARQLRDELRRQGLEGAFVARARGDYGHQHDAGELALLVELAKEVDSSQCGRMSPGKWLAQQDLRRRYSMQVHLLYVEGISGVNDAIRHRDAVAAELGECGLLNEPGGGYRLFCGAYNSLGDAHAAFREVSGVTGVKPRVVSITTDGLGTDWRDNDPER